MASGIIYPCKMQQDSLDDQSFIIFTNKHVIKDLIELNQQDAKLHLLVEFIMYDKNSNKIDVSKHLAGNGVQLFFEDDGEEGTNSPNIDIAAFLLIFDKFVELDLELKISLKEQELEEIFIEGFPQVLQDDKISSKIQLKGIHKPIFPLNNSVGVFQIKDDYHWYSNYKDLRLFQGFSGGPIYLTQNKENYIVGMNQSLSNISDGENPFKLVYYYKFSFILEYLREKGCIIFNKNRDQSVTIRWIFNRVVSEQKEINLLLLGASGAGKSSFIKTFLLHGHLIDSTNDGQTTRSNIIYSVSLYQEKPSVVIKFLDKDQFVERMYRLNYENYLLEIILIITPEFKRDTLEDFIKFKLRKNVITENPLNDSLNSRMQKIILSSASLNYENKMKQKDELYSVVEEILNSEFSSKEFFVCFWDNNFERIKKVLSRIEGFFNEYEFDYLSDENIGVKEQLTKKDLNIIDGTTTKLDKEEGCLIKFRTYYEKLHEKIIDLLIAKSIVRKNNFKKEFYFHDFAFMENLLPFCLQVKNNKSLTGIIEYIKITDSISNEYSFLMHELALDSLKLIDTYGLDHVNWDREKGEVLSDIVYTLVEQDEVRFNSNLAVLYIKKLDSGKPTELMSMLPQIYNLIPQSPVYCIFTGLDLFFNHNLHEISSFDYLNKSESLPKTIQYLLSDRCRQELKQELKGRTSFIENLYLTLRNNIVSFCCEPTIINSYINVYESNFKEIYKLLLSISMNEYSSMNLTPTYIIDDLERGKNNQDIDIILGNIFKAASRTDWNGSHYKTRLANYNRIEDHKTLGYWGTYRHQWNQLFHLGYVETISRQTSALISGISREEDQQSLESSIRNMEYDFLGKAQALKNVKLDTESSEFRNLIQKMYCMGYEKQLYQMNPFEKQENNTANPSPEEKINLLNNVFDFTKGLELIKEELRKHFIKCLIETIKKENRDKSFNMLKINRSFVVQLDKLKHDFEKKYSKTDFNELMKYRFEKP